MCDKNQRPNQRPNQKPKPQGDGGIIKRKGAGTGTRPEPKRDNS